MQSLSRNLLVLLTLVGCAGGEETEGGVSFGGPGGGPGPQAVPPVTDGASESSAATGTATTSGDSEAMTTRPTDPTMPTTGGNGVETGIDPDTSTTLPDTSGVDPDTTDADPSTSTGPVILCGNATIDAPEECDGANLNGQSCTTLGFTGGALSCTPQCIFDKSMCTSPSCGDGTVDPGEECDCGNQGVNCTGAQLANAACTSLPGPLGPNYAGGTLACNSPNSCSFNKGGCIYCGDGVRNGAESCDGGDLGGQSCTGLGYSGGGNLGCNGDCSYNTGGCFNIVCGDGQCHPGEDSCSCPPDCPDDPSTCSPCQCGGLGGNCYCDPACVSFGDCCVNGPC